MANYNTNWENKSVLVTGAGGFIGSHLTERLIQNGAKVRGFVHYNSLGRWGWLDQSKVKDDIEVFVGDIADRDSIRNAVMGVDVVFHLAALIGIPYSYQAPSSYVQTNIVGTLNVLQSALETGVERVVHTSTSEAYGSAQYVPIDEDHSLQGQSPYSATKIGADKLAESFYRSFGLPVATIRPFNTYGPRQSARAIIPTIISQALNQSELRLGNLSPTRDLNYVADTVEGFLHVASSPKSVGEVINIGTGKEISMGELVDLVVELMGKNISIVSENARIRPEASEVDRLCADISKAKRLLDWQPKFSLKEGLQKTITWVEANIKQYQPDVYSV
jgi:NAD dependent epimerase/dehydratase